MEEYSDVFDKAMSQKGLNPGKLQLLEELVCSLTGRHIGAVNHVLDKLRRRCKKTHEHEFQAEQIHRFLLSDGFHNLVAAERDFPRCSSYACPAPSKLMCLACCKICLGW